MAWQSTDPCSLARDFGWMKNSYFVRLGLVFIRMKTMLLYVCCGFVVASVIVPILPQTSVSQPFCEGKANLTSPGVHFCALCMVGFCVTNHLSESRLSRRKCEQHFMLVDGSCWLWMCDLTSGRPGMVIFLLMWDVYLFVVLWVSNESERRCLWYLMQRRWWCRRILYHRRAWYCVGFC